MPDRLVARHLARALDGEPTGIEEADALALLLRDAAASAWFEVTGEQTERALGSIARDGRPASRPGRRRLLAAAVIAAAAVIGFFALPGSHAPGVDVSGQALAAINTPGPVQVTVMRVSRPGGGDQVLRTDWVDLASGRTRVQIEVNGRVVSEMLREPDGRVVSYQEGAPRALLAASCRSIAGGCSELVDPIDFYRRALKDAGAGTVQMVAMGGRPGYRFSLPVQRGGPGVTGVAQVVTVDASTFLPRRIVWQEHPAGDAVDTVAVLDFVSITDVSQSDQVGAFSLGVPPGTRLVQLDESGAALGAPIERSITLAQARQRFPHAHWLGPRFNGHPLSSVRELRWPAGSALQLRYGPLTLWSFDRVIPPDLLEGLVLPVKLLAQSGVTERFYRTASGRLAAERDLPSGSLAAVAPSFGKIDLFAALARARPL
ncbi:MAG: hypothetical protein QOG33_673 [Gaiellales bacterium]|jgi:hypothetical protein|nr:hypothetical protein [Gaiellales bacterium]